MQLPGIESLLETEIHLEEMLLAQRTLMSEKLSFEERSSYLQEVRAAEENFQESWDHFLSLPAIAEVERLIGEFETAIADWIKLNDRWLRLNEEFEAMDVLAPADLLASIEQFRGDHYSLELNVALFLLNGREFEGGGDPTACSFGRWLRDYSSRNSEVNRLLEEIREPHNRFHQAVTEIRSAYRAGDLQSATDIFEREMLPASAEVFLGFEALGEIADEANSRRDEMTDLVVGEITTEAYEAMDVLDELIHINENLTTDRVATADTDGAQVELIALVGMVLGVLLALLLGVILTRGITAPMAKGVGFAKAIAAGNLDIELDVRQKDEVGQLADALRFMLKSLKYKEGVVTRIAEKDLTVEVDPASDQDKLGYSLKEMVQSLNDILSQVNVAVEQVNGGSDQVSQASTASAEESASAAEELAGQAQQLRSMVAQFKLQRAYFGSRQGRLEDKRAPRRDEKERSKAAGYHESHAAGYHRGPTADQGTAQSQNKSQASFRDQGSRASDWGSGKKEASKGRAGEETGITPVRPEDQIALDDDDFDRF
ncbi:MAG TPA: HAMP domain-containing protein [Sediminispirochaeta sp.]|nr:HAMP domain-containing protein [Sediminispirochaeta sp.]